ncbi:MAG: Zn-ribbon domain-containing OB-fold protein [Desulfatitalea sp.]|nr:Zn-ribbon domain-containing OB-fold protein [Desulfatitalea sp.]NNK02542.1 Zn-ribbon domain-containing OB-fold protein [Desulfatitalea sp.]
MMPGQDFKKESPNIPITVDVPYRFAAGKYLSKFLIEMRDNGVFYGIQCPACGRVQVPPRVVCAVCHVKNETWVELGNEGVLKGFTTMHMPLTDPTTGKPHQPPFAYGTVKLDGCDSGVDHMINPAANLETIKIGMRVRVVLRPKQDRIGDLSDILYFDPIEG